MAAFTSWAASLPVAASATSGRTGTHDGLVGVDRHGSLLPCQRTARVELRADRQTCRGLEPTITWAAISRYVPARALQRYVQRPLELAAAVRIVTQTPDRFSWSESTFAFRQLV